MAAPHDVPSATPTELVTRLRDLVVALDQRVPHVERSGEAAIARDAQALRTRALRRIAELEAQSPADAPTDGPVTRNR